MLAHLNQVAASLGLPFGERKTPYNRQLAQELGLWAQSQGKGHAAGLQRKVAEEVLDQRSFSSAVDNDWELSRKCRITAVPTFYLEGATLTGAQPYKDLVKFLDRQTGGLSPR